MSQIKRLFKLILGVSFVLLLFFISSCDGEKKYTVKFFDEKNEIISIPVRAGFNVEVPIAPTSEEGKTFNGWYIDEELTTPFDFGTIISSNINLYAAWSLNDYTITIHTDDENIEYNYKYRDIIRLNDLKKEDYIFGGYYYDEEHTKKFDLVLMPKENIDLYPLFIKMEHFFTLIYHTNCDINIESVTKEKDDLDSIELPILTREGYTFNGWYLDSNYTEEYSIDKLVEGNNELYAKWTINEYKIIVHNDGNEIEYKFNYNEPIVLRDIEKPDYTFEGYYINENLTNTFDLVTMPSKNIDLYAKITKNKHFYNLIYHTNCNIKIDSVIKEKDDLDTIELPALTREGYTFNGWYLSSDCNEEYSINKLTEGNNELYSKWTVNEYKVTVHFDDNEIECKFNYNDPIILNNLEKNDYTFEGYYIDENLTKKLDFITMPSKDMDLYAKFKKNKHFYTINYMVDNSKGYLLGDSNQYIEENYKTNEVEVKALEGYRFIGWDDSTIISKRSDTVTNNATYTALFEKVFKLEIINGTPDYGKIEGETIQYLVEGEESSLVEAIPNLGYKFKSWSNDNINTAFSISINQDTKIYANFVTDYLELPVMEIYTNDRSPIVSKEEYVSCKVSVSNAEYEYTFDSLGGKIKGRGNSTWGQPKKPYKLKFDKKVDLFGNGEAKTWTLIANYLDKSMLRNYFAYSLGELIGLETTTSIQFVDLYLNSEYIGVYLVCEQNEVGETRVNISDSLSFIDTGYLLELDARIVDEGGTEGIDYFYFKNQAYAIKSPDTESSKYNSEFTDFIVNYLNLCFTAIENNDWTSINDLIDVDSFAKAYYINEIMKVGDIGLTSFYIYKKENGKLYCGPIWDYDTSSGNNSEVQGVMNPSNLYARNNKWFDSLLKVPQFNSLVSIIINNYYLEFIKSINTLLKIDTLPINSIERNYQKWDVMNEHVLYNPTIVDNIHTWEGQVEYLRDWLLKSLDYIYNYYVNPSNDSYSIKYNVDEHSNIRVYNTNDYKYDAIVLENAWSRNLTTGELVKDGTGSIAFRVLLEDGYVVDSITINDNTLCDAVIYDDINDVYIINNIKGNIQVTISTKEQEPEEPEISYYNISFVVDNHIQIRVYPGQDYSVEGAIVTEYHLNDISGDGQVNFKVLLDDGYIIDSINVVGEYNKQKDMGDNIYRLTKVKSNLTITITSKVS